MPPRDIVQEIDLLLHLRAVEDPPTALLRDARAEILRLRDTESQLAAVQARVRELEAQYRERGMLHRVKPPGARVTLAELNAAYAEISTTQQDIADALGSLTPPEDRR